MVSRGGRRLDVDVHDVGVIDSTGVPAVGVPAVVSFRMTWRGAGRAHRRGQGLAVSPADAKAFLGRFFAARAQGTFSGASGAFTFQSDPGRGARTLFGVLGTEQTGALLPGAPGCEACARQQPTDPDGDTLW